MMIKKLMLPTFGLSLLLSYSLTFAVPEMLDRVVVVVDKSIITQSQLDMRMQEIALRAAQAGMRLPPEDVLKSQILDQLISETLQLNMAARYGVQISDAEINNTIEGIKSNNGWTDEQFAYEIAKEGSTLNEFRERIRKEMRVRNVSQGVVQNRIRISEQEISNFLKSADAQFWISPDYRLGHILVSLPPSPSNSELAEAEQKADRLYQQLLKGANFEELAIANSSGPSALNGGDLGFRKSGDLPTLFAEIAPTLQIGQVAPPARSQAGFHILKLKDKKGETKQIVSQVRVRHILIKPSAILDSKKAKAKLVDIRNQIVSGDGDFTDLAKDFSDDIGSKLQGGEMDWTTPETFVQEFASAIRNSKIGEISEPFETQFGWHILEVMERRQEDLTQEAIRHKARQMLTSRRFEDETQVWLQEMRDDAFIDIKI
ncbi:periplasmic chaperone for outer membrane proteins SurA [Alteromonadaceae bacterium Bs31]|nr:periplasmic chaperone for outer membrane proteins SurA [Alteromonadaceae bacterium Bs31]